MNFWPRSDVGCHPVAGLLLMRKHSARAVSLQAAYNIYTLNTC
jgi:hypothetical protein